MVGETYPDIVEVFVVRVGCRVRIIDAIRLHELDLVATRPVTGRCQAVEKIRCFIDYDKKTIHNGM